MKKNLKGILKKIISKQFKCSMKNIKLDSGISKDDIEDWDSFGNLELILSVEKELKIKFLSKNINKINNFKTLLKQVEIVYER